MNVVIATQAEDFHKLLLSRLPAHAILLAGPSGVGLRTIASLIARTHGEVSLIEPEFTTKASTTKQIGVERIRELYEQVRTKHSRRRVIVIDDADMMTVAAQNALLKLLEEPNDSTSFILTSHQPDQLLPTIRSRLQAYIYPVISKAQTVQLLAAFPSIPSQKQAQLLFIATGLPAELTRLLHDEQQFRLKASIFQQAKELLGSSSYDTIAKILNTKPSRQASIDLIDTLIILLSRQPSKAGLTKINKLLESRKSVVGGGNVALQLGSAMV